MKLDKKQSAGKQFATLTTEGYVPCDVIITVTIWSPQQWRDWQLNVAPLIRPVPGAKFNKTPKAINIVHPATMSADIEGIVIENVTGPSVGRSQDIREFKIKAVQWNSEMKASVTETPKGGAITDQSNPKSTLSPKNKPSRAEVPTKP
jgi:hypothetical protein